MMKLMFALIIQINILTQHTMKVLIQWIHFIRWQYNGKILLIHSLNHQAIRIIYKIIKKWNWCLIVKVFYKRQNHCRVILNFQLQYSVKTISSWRRIWNCLLRIIGIYIIIIIKGKKTRARKMKEEGLQLYMIYNKIKHKIHYLEWLKRERILNLKQLRFIKNLYERVHFRNKEEKYH